MCKIRLSVLAALAVCGANAATTTDLANGLLKVVSGTAKRNVTIRGNLSVSRDKVVKDGHSRLTDGKVAIGAYETTEPALGMMLYLR